jgi:hypothetical protein
MSYLKRGWRDRGAVVSDAFEVTSEPNEFNYFPTQNTT